MTLWFDPQDGTFDAYDHNGDLMADSKPLDSSWTFDRETGRVTRPPQEFFDAVNSAFQGDQPSAYNQSLNKDLSTRQIQIGTP